MSGHHIIMKSSNSIQDADIVWIISTWTWKKFDKIFKGQKSSCINLSY